RIPGEPAKESGGGSQQDIAKLREEQHLDVESANRLAIEKELGPSQGLVVSTIERKVALGHVARLRQSPDAERTQAVAETVDTLLTEGLLDSASLDLDLALFGRMVAAVPKFNIEAAASVSHAITTHAFNIEVDYFSAGEELNVLGGTGAAITQYG